MCGTEISYAEIFGNEPATTVKQFHSYFIILFQFRFTCAGV